MKKLIGVCAGFTMILLFANVTTDAFGGGKAIAINLEAFAKEWKADRAGTGKKYNGKMVTFTGPIFYFSIDLQRKSTFSVRVEPGNNPAQINVHAKGNSEPWATYSAGQAVTVQGKFEYDGTAVVRDATVTTKAKNSTPTLKSTDLGAEATPDRDKAAKKYLDQGVFVTGEVVKMNDRKDVVFLKGKDAVLIECHMFAVDKPALGAALTVGKETKLFGMIREQLSPILDDSKNLRVRDCFPVTGAKKK